MAMGIALGLELGLVLVQAIVCGGVVSFAVAVAVYGLDIVGVDVEMRNGMAGVR